jgi:epoxyqueuosine reductase
MTRCSKQQIKALAAQVGLAEVGVTDASPFPEMIPWLTAYAERGRTGFEAADIAQRIQPTSWLASAKSIVVAALPYLTDTGHTTARTHPRGRQHGNVSTYVYGTDYHHVLTERLRDLGERLTDLYGQNVEYKVAVDMSPLVDRRVAERAGLGWVGKNCMFYSHRYGSFVFLGALLVNVEIESNNQPPALGSRCGECALCLKACPTGALVAPGVIEATRCLSYVTQMKGVIPREFRSKMGRRVWGCDVCQWVCPENSGAEHSDIPAFEPLPELAYPDLIEFLHLSNRQFLRRYGHTALAWRGLRTLQRNALIALGNAGHVEAIAEIIPFLQHARQELRVSAAWALGQLGGQEALVALESALAQELDEVVSDELKQAIKRVMMR